MPPDVDISDAIRRRNLMMGLTQVNDQGQPLDVGPAPINGVPQQAPPQQLPPPNLPAVQAPPQASTPISQQPSPYDVSKQGQFTPVPQQQQQLGPVQFNLPQLPNVDISDYSDIAKQYEQAVKDSKTAEDFPQSTGKKILASIYDIKRWPVDPAKFHEFVNEASRPGWASYEQQNAAHLAQLKTRMEAAKEVVNQKLSIYKDILTGSKDAADFQIKMRQLAHAEEMAPLEKANMLASTAHLVAETDAQRVDNVPWLLHLKDGNTTIAQLTRPTYGSKELPVYTDLTTMKPVPMGEYTNPERLTNQTLPDLQKLFVDSEIRKAKAEGKEPDMDAISDKWFKKQGEQPWQRLMQVQDENRKRDQLRELHDSANRQYATVKSYIEGKAVPIQSNRENLDQARIALQGALDAYNKGDNAGFMAWMGKIKTVVGSVGGMRSVNRYNTNEIAGPDVQGGMIAKYINDLANFAGLSSTGTVPIQAVKQMLKYLNLMDRDLGIQQKVINGHLQRIGTALKNNDVDALVQAQGDYDVDMEKVKYMTVDQQNKFLGLKDAASPDDVRNAYKKAKGQ